MASETTDVKEGKLLGEYLKQNQHYVNIYGPNTILIMLVGSFYEIYALKTNQNQSNYEGSAIEEVSRICDLIVTQKSHKYNNKFIYQSGFRDLYWDKYVERLTQNNFCVVKFDQDSKDKTQRKLSQIYSPGTFFQSNNYSLSNNTTCVWIERFTSKHNPCYLFGFSTIDIYSGKTNIFELCETPVQHKILGDEIERYMTIYNPSEMLCIFRNVQEDEQVYSMVVKMFNHHCSKITYITSKSAPELWKQILNCGKDTYIQSSIEQFYKSEYVSIVLQHLRESSVALQSLIYLLHWIVKHNPYLIENLQLPLVETHSKHVYLANNSLKQLNYTSNNILSGNGVNNTSGQSIYNLKQNEYGNQKYNSVIDLLNQCITPMGKRELQVELCHPVFDVELLQNKYDITEQIIQSPKLIENIRIVLRSCFDVDKLKRTLVMRKITPNMFHNLYSSLQTVPVLYDEIISAKSPILTENFIKFKYEFQNDKTYDAKTLYSEFNSVFLRIFNVSQLANNHNGLLDKNIFAKHYDKELDDTQDKIHNNDAQIQELINTLQNLLINGGYEKKGKCELIKINFTDKSPPTLLCTKKRGDNIVKALQDVINKNIETHSSNKMDVKSPLLNVSGDLVNLHVVKYTTSNVSLQCDYIQKLMKQQFSLQNKFRTQLNETFTRAKNELIEYYSHIDIMSSFISLIDTNVSKGFVIEKYNYVKPKLMTYAEYLKLHYTATEKREQQKERKEIDIPEYSNMEVESSNISDISDNNMSDNTDNITSYVIADDIRHCLVEQFQNEDCYVANDIHFDGSQQGVLLFGTNAVGKTCFMKAIGICIIMAQCGMYVPCSNFVFYPYKKLFTRILNQDNIFKGLSTFANEMTELRNILNNATSDSLVLGDELCSGTEHESALSIFVSGLSYLYNKNVQFLFATHLHEIVNYEEIKQMKHLEKYHLTVHYNREKDTLVYDRKLKLGSGIPIYGLEVCQSLHLPDTFIKYAYDIRNKYYPSHISILDAKTSHFNATKVVAYCELCKVEKADEVHHLMFQKNANNNGILKDHRNKNHKSNLFSLCVKCHNKIHGKSLELKRKKTTKGYILEELNLEENGYEDNF